MNFIRGIEKMTVVAGKKFRAGSEGKTTSLLCLNNKFFEIIA